MKDMIVGLTAFFMFLAALMAIGLMLVSVLRAGISWFAE